MDALAVCRDLRSGSVAKVDIPDQRAAVIELTVTARVKPSEADAVKQRLLDPAGTRLAAA